MAYSWQFRIMNVGNQNPLQKSAEQHYTVRHQVGKYLATFYTLAETLAYDFVPEDVKKSVRTIASAAKFSKLT